MRELVRPPQDSMILRNATVKAVDTAGRTCTLELDAEQIPGVPYLAHLAPAVNLRVKVAVHGRGLLVIGTLDPAGEASSPTNFRGVVADAAAT